ncbi:unnamed protein product [Caenorhabditis brenneri]
MNTPRFRLYRLPLVALSVVFDCMAPHVVFRLSLISKKSHRITKSLRRIPEMLDMFLCEHASIVIRSKNYRFPLLYIVNPDSSEPTESLRINDELIQIGMDREQDDMLIHWEQDRFLRLTHLCDYVREFYHLPIYWLSITCEINSSEPKKALDWILNRQETIPEVSFECDPTQEGEFRYFFYKIENRVTEFLFIVGGPNEHFRYTFRQPLTAEHIDIEGALWFTLDNLYSMNSRWLHVESSNLTCENMNSFLKEWQLNGGNSNTRFMDLGIPLKDAEVILNGLEVIRRDFPDPIEYYYDEGKVEFKVSYELRRSDGTIASIVIDDPGKDDFYMLVWPDWNGRLYPVQELE